MGERSLNTVPAVGRQSGVLVISVVKSGKNHAEKKHKKNPGVSSLHACCSSGVGQIFVSCRFLETQLDFLVHQYGFRVRSLQKKNTPKKYALGFVEEMNFFRLRTMFLPARLEPTCSYFSLHTFCSKWAIFVPVETEPGFYNILSNVIQINKNSSRWSKICCQC